MIRHKWSKSHQMASHRASILVPAVPDSILCPRESFIRMVQWLPTMYTNQPLLMFSNGNHMTGPYLRKIWRTAMVAIGVPNGECYSLHGIRRGAATYVISQDPGSREDIKRHGMWELKAVDEHLPKTSSKVFTIMKKLQ